MGLTEDIPTGYVDSLAASAAHDIPLVALRDNPRFDQPPVTCVQNKGAAAPACDTPRARLYADPAPFDRAPDLPDGVHFVDTSRLLLRRDDLPAGDRQRDRLHGRQPRQRHLHGDGGTRDGRGHRTATRLELAGQPRATLASPPPGPRESPTENPRVPQSGPASPTLRHRESNTPVPRVRRFRAARMGRLARPERWTRRSATLDSRGLSGGLAGSEWGTRGGWWGTRGVRRRATGACRRRSATGATRCRG